MFFSPVSSQEFVAAQPAAGPELVDTLAALSADEPLPATYRRDNVRLLAQSPRKVYVYWDLAGDPFAPLKLAFGPQQADGYRLMVRLVNVETDAEMWAEAAATRMQSFNVQPDQSYRAEIGLYADGRAFIRLLASDEARTPRASVAPEVAQTAEFSVSADDFARVLDEAGYTGDALEVALEAADADAQQLSRTIAQRLSQAELPALDNREEAELRSLLAALALGYRPDQLNGLLSATLNDWLAAAERQGAVSHGPLLAALQEMLGLVISGTSYDADAAQRRTRFSVGGSQVNLPRNAHRLWMPSMTAGRAR